MKSILIITVMTCAVIVQAQKIEFQNFTSLDVVLMQAQKENKAVFIDTYASWCGWCKYMDQNIFNDSGVATFYNDAFINVKVNADKSSSNSFTYKYDISGLPALLILDPNGVVLERSDGAFTDVDEFIDFGKAAQYSLHPETGPWHESRVRYEKGERSSSFLVDHAFNLLDAEADDSEIEEVVRTFWKNADSKSLENEDNLLMYFVFNDDLNHEMTRRFVQEQDRLLDLYGEELIYEKYISLIQINLYDAIDSNDSQLFAEVKEFAKRAFKDSEIVDLDEILEEIDEVWEDA